MAGTLVLTVFYIVASSKLPQQWLHDLPQADRTMFVSDFASTHILPSDTFADFRFCFWLV